MGFAEAVKTCFRRCITFSGRASRPEYWWFALFVFLGGLVGAALDTFLFGPGNPEDPSVGLVQPLFSLATILPMLAAGWRRLHDTGRPGWYLLIPLAISVATVTLILLGAVGLGLAEGGTGSVEDPGAAAAPLGGVGLGVMLLGAAAQLLAIILVVVWLTRPGEPGPNAYGSPPLAAS